MSYPVCIFIKNIKSADREARKFLAEEGNELLKAGALIVESPLSDALEIFFLYINRPNIPARLSTDKNEAEKWLRKFF